MYFKFTILLLFFALSAQAQFGWGGDKAIKAIKKTETLVLLEQNDSYNEAIIAAFEEHWTFTEFKFISAPHYKKYCSDKKYSFVMPFMIKDWAFEEEKYMDVGIVQGGRCRVSSKDMVAFANLLTWGDEDRYKSECVRAVQLMQNYLEMGMETSLFVENFEETAELYTKDRAKVKEMSLLLDVYNLLEECREPEILGSYYPHKILLGTTKDIERVTLEQSPDIAYHLVVFDTRGYKYHMVIQAKDSKVLSCNEARKKETILLGKKNLHLLAE